MALTRPTLLSMVAFDATQSATFTFNVIGGDQVVKNRLVIRNNSTNEIVYNEIQETFRYNHVVNADELQNGINYNAVISTFNSAGVESATSVPIQFWCYSEPSIRFTNIPTSGKIDNSSYNFQFTYTQAENEKLNSYIVNLYNSFHVLIATSKTRYAVNGTPPFLGNYLFSGFLDNTQYYIEINGVTIEGTQITSGQIPITVDYINPDVYTLMIAENNCDEGYVYIRSNIIIIEGKSVPDPPVYINDEEVDLRANGSYVEWDNGYNFSNDYLTRVWFRNPNPNKEIVRFSNTSGETVSINYMVGYENVSASNTKSYIEVIVTNVEGLSYSILSNYITTLSSSQYYYLQMSNINNLYDVTLHEIT